MLLAIVFLFKRRRRSNSVRVKDDFDLGSPIDHRNHFFPNVNTAPTPWTPEPPEGSHSRSPSNGDVPLMREARPKYTHRSSDGSAQLLSTLPSEGITRSSTPFTSPEPSEPVGPLLPSSSGSGAYLSLKRARSGGLPDETVPNESTSHIHGEPADHGPPGTAGTLRQEDVGVAVPPPPSYRESSYRHSESDATQMT